MSAAIRELRLFVAVYEEQSFTLAAEREHVTQSGASQHVKKLEQQLAVRLFHRKKGLVTSTPAGDIFYKRCIEVLRTYDSAIQAARAFHGKLEGHVRIGIMPTLARRVLAPALSRMLQDHPNVYVQVVEGYSAALSDLVRADRLDFAVIPSHPATRGLRARHFIRTPEALISGAASNLTNRRPVRLAELGPVNMIVPSSGNVRRAVIDGYCSANHVEIVRTGDVDGILATLDFVARTDWVTILPALLFGAEQPVDTYRVNPLVPELSSDIAVIEPTRRPLSAASEATLILLLQEAQAELAGWNLAVEMTTRSDICPRR